MIENMIQQVRARLAVLVVNDSGMSTVEYGVIWTLDRTKSRFCTSNAD